MDLGRPYKHSTHNVFHVKDPLARIGRASARPAVGAQDRP